VDITALESAYRAGKLTPTHWLDKFIVISRNRASGRVDHARTQRAQLSRAAELEASASSDGLPLFGIPFAVKDNFDVEGLPTTAACPAFAHHATETATVVERLLDAGAI